jgi:hypothetical protein
MDFPMFSSTKYEGKQNKITSGMDGCAKQKKGMLGILESMVMESQIFSG